MTHLGSRAGAGYQVDSAPYPPSAQLVGDWRELDRGRGRGAPCVFRIRLCRVQDVGEYLGMGPTDLRRLFCEDPTEGCSRIAGRL